jgi:nucleoside-diphosphate-sugar epimerase
MDGAADHRLAEAGQADVTVLVTGASGFVGGAIVRHLAAHGHSVRAAARCPEAVPAIAGVKPCLIGDVGGDLDWRALVAGSQCVVHAAGLAHQAAGTTEADLLRVNAEAAGHLAGAAVAAGVSRFVLISSIRAISGPTSASALTETDAPAPTDAYGRSKLVGEATVRAAFPDATILRPPVVHGALAKGNMNRLAAWARSPWPLPLAGLTAPRSLVSDRNLASAVEFAVTAPDARGALFHVDDGTPMSIAEIVAAMRAALGRPAGLFGASAPMLGPALALLPRGLSQQLSGGLTLSARRLADSGWRPVETSHEGLARTVLG